MHHRKRQASVDTPPVKQDRAGTALTVVAALLRAVQPQIVPQKVKERCARVDINDMTSSIYSE